MKKEYFNEGRWEYLKNKYSNIKKKGYSSVFFGDSMTENFFEVIQETDSIINMGISGDFTEGLLKRINNVTDFQPDNVFIMIGINDLIEKVSLNEIKENYRTIIEILKTKCPKTKIFIQSNLPTYGLKSTFSSSRDINYRVLELNKYLENLAKQEKVVFINLYDDFVNQKNELKPELTTDGVHLRKQGYQIWKSRIIQFLN